MSARVPGHALVGEGVAHDDDGVRLAGLHIHTGGAGRGKCSCGELSGILPSGTARKAWHREHKEDAAKGRARDAWPMRDRVAALIDPEAFRWQAAGAARDVARKKADEIIVLVTAGAPSGG